MIPFARGYTAERMPEALKRDPVLFGCRLMQNTSDSDLQPGAEYKGGLVDHYLPIVVPPGFWFWWEPKE